MKRKKRMQEAERKMMETKNPDAVHIQAAGGLLFNAAGDLTNPDILLIYRNGVWDLPKGKREKGELIAECAAREVQEEVGLRSMPVIVAELGITRHTYTLKDQMIEKETFWFVMQLDEHVTDFKPQRAEGITKVEWVPADEALGKVGYENLKEIIRRFSKHSKNLESINLNNR